MTTKLRDNFDVTVEILHTNPNIIAYHGLLSKEETEHLINISDQHLRRSCTFTSANDSRRTSSTMFCNMFETDPVVRKVIHRCACLSSYPINNVEIPQIVRYLPGEHFASHSDCYPKDHQNYKWNGQRDFTFFIYLNDAGTCDPENSEINAYESGGETFFDGLNFKVKPKCGTAIFWRNIDLDNNELPYRRISHCGLPPKDWTKYGMNVWIRHKYFNHYNF